MTTTEKIATLEEVEELDRLTEHMQPAPKEQRRLMEVTPEGLRPVAPSRVADRVELKLGSSGYAVAPDPRTKAPPLLADGPSRRRPERMCMRANTLEIISDGTARGTQIIVNGVLVVGAVRFEMSVQKGYPRVAAMVETTYERMNLPEYAEFAGREVAAGDKPATVVVDVFERT